MSKIEKMNVFSVWSLGTEDKDKQVMSFFSLLTGPVGSLLTVLTIIYMTQTKLLNFGEDPNPDLDPINCLFVFSPLRERANNDT
uniref:Uncharacterized protein n=1 Tax=Eptatretus burgeri TaxID=7764 RepID=A0A8C4NCE5_EPTBU